MEGRRKKVEGK
jgi:hypothetical protein